MASDTVWLAQREYESRIVYQELFRSKETAKEELAKRIGKSASDLNWEPLDYPQDDNEVVDDELELHEKLIVKEKIIHE